MATITLEYDARNSALKKGIELLLALGAKEKKPKKMTGIEISMQEVKEGKVNRYKSSKELFEKLGI
ncbi:MAG TPA: hypothetical protein PK984_04525 [Paludibacteraceae bacterium]|nr:hypothetical protein [Paludibacteraceae bacterium]HOS37462.1 hypothetical protein [Paludibacteraceae bacterium]HPK20332.1 hypothetical protein [Paludibacteraceae bacterium]